MYICKLGIANYWLFILMVLHSGANGMDSIINMMTVVKWQLFVVDGASFACISSPENSHFIEWLRKAWVKGVSLLLAVSSRCVVFVSTSWQDGTCIGV